MKCPKCGNVLRDDMFCENCKEYLLNMNKPKKGETAKSWLKIASITLGIFIVVIGIVIGIVIISETHAYNEQINAKYEETYRDFTDENYYSALSDIKEFQESDNGKHRKMSKKYNELYQQIEEKIYSTVMKESDNNAKTLCIWYSEYYPNGKYTEDIEKRLSEIANEVAIDDLASAKDKINSEDILEADDLLQNIINDENVSKQTIEQAKLLADSISQQVRVERAKSEIIGTWEKDTGVRYTFEKDGHMSVSLSNSYDKSAGTATDGSEVTKLLREIEQWGRIVRGGTWKYLGDYEECPTYSLFYDGSRNTCLIKDNALWIDSSLALNLGMGDPSVLHRKSIY